MTNSTQEDNHPYLFMTKVDRCYVGVHEEMGDERIRCLRYEDYTPQCSLMLTHTIDVFLTFLYLDLNFD